MPVPARHRRPRDDRAGPHPRGSAWHQGGSIGFANYVDCPHTPRHPFGHGLTYTTFAYTDLRVEAADVAPDGAVVVTFRFPVTQLAFLDADLRWVVEAGEIDLLVGASSEDIRLRGEVRIASDANVEGRDRGFFAGTSESQA
ncbi:fibronectin type III-like domain-contianing protein [Propioniciclava soli]|uniref:Fibronectin type III-like domain-contianing protein n=1 Tax=Propioniciclava soli TaxID=2775081 RepID=A0ABZ3C3G3_9ACTN